MRGLCFETFSIKIWDFNTFGKFSAYNWGSKQCLLQRFDSGVGLAFTAFISSISDTVGGQETRAPSRHFYILYAMYRSIDTNHTSLKMASQRCMSLEIHPRFHSLGLDESIINTRSVGWTIQQFTVPMIRFNKSRLQVIQEGNSIFTYHILPFFWRTC